MRSSFAALTILAAVLFGPALCPTTQAADTAQPALINLIAQTSQRLALADAVAYYKWLKSQDITDRGREQALLADVARRAPAYGVDPELAQTFFSDQIAANKFVQQALIATWNQTPPAPHAVPDLAHGIRPQLDQLTSTLLIALARVEALRQADDCPLQLARSLAEWRRLNDSDSLHEQALKHALTHVCSSGGVGASA